MLSRKTFDPFLLLLYCNTVNILFFAFQLSSIVITRPIISYDYFLVGLCIAFEVHPLVTLLSFAFVLLLDLFNQISIMYLFDLVDFSKNLEFIFLYNFSGKHYFLLVLFILFLSANYWVIKKLTINCKQQNRVFVLAVLVLPVILVYTLDTLNGKSSTHVRRVISSPYNFGGSSFIEFTAVWKSLTKETSAPTKIVESATFQTFKNDSVTNQLLVIIESWGMPDSASNFDAVRSIIEKTCIENGWKTYYGKTAFKGSTFHAELRELTCLHGDYRYLLDEAQAHAFESIFTIKKRQGYITYGVHSFSEKMFQRRKWWRNIGIDSTFFLEDISRQAKISANELNSDTPFLSLSDEDAFSFINQRETGKPTFAYFLTENSHLPYGKIGGNTKDSLTFGNSISYEASSQLMRILEIIHFIAVHADKKKWDKILLVGDHMPPFTRKPDRQFYSDKFVPFVVLHK